MPADQTLEKLTVEATDDSDKIFTAFVNPASINYRVNIHYNVPERSGNGVGQQVQYNRTEPERISFSLDLDGTGVIGNEKINVDEKVEEFKDVTLKYDGTKHEPQEVKLAWGSFIFECRLESLDINYTLFAPSGRPLRAKLNVAFIGTMSEDEAARRRNNSSPDLSHVRVVQAGDTLPLMCFQIYGDCTVYLEVARMNNLVDFRRLKPGTEIVFPPIKK
jgi:Contractile injection system tube protein